MFERRLKVFMGILAGVSLAILLRCAHLQVAHGEDWRKEAEKATTQPVLLATSRGRIIDYRKTVLAQDEPCIDAAVQYQAIDRDEKWIAEVAKTRLGATYRRSGNHEREQLLAAEAKRVNADLDAMWAELAAVSGQSADAIEETKASIRWRVETRKRSLWYQKYSRELKVHAIRESDAWFRQWRLGSGSAPELDSVEVEVPEMGEAHVILPDISNEVNNRLKKQADKFPGLVIRPSKYRIYPCGSAASHLIGYLARVDQQDMLNDPNHTEGARQYLPMDLIGRAGIEALCETALRGSRGHRVLDRARNVLAEVPPVDGRDVRITIDINLQMQLENAFNEVEFTDNHFKPTGERHEMHGAAVVIDVPTGQVRALVSAPRYDLNDLDQKYAEWADDFINKPLLNRAAQFPVEPGSTVKPIVGLGAVTQGLMTVDQGIECSGYLRIDGIEIRHGYRCWTASKYSKEHPELVPHHQIPVRHLTGELTLTDAIQRSCNVYFETVADKLGLEGLSDWYWRFGLGRVTGIGIAEATGQLPISYKGDSLKLRRAMSWYCGIGQTYVRATPLQMANVAATIVRDGIWIRPTLVVSKEDIGRPTTQRSQAAAPDRVDLQLNPDALAAVKEGMFRVVNTSAGTGGGMFREDFVLCGKSGTAEAAPLKIPKRDESGRVIKDEKGKVVMVEAAISTPKHPNPAMLWYRGAGTDGESPRHAWFIGYAPRENPQIAFAVLIEYGGSGGHDTYPIVKVLLDACIEHGYLVVNSLARKMTGHVGAGWLTLTQRVDASGSWSDG